jgi:hypothetical protein
MASTQGHVHWALEADHAYVESLLSAVIAAVTQADEHALSTAWATFEHHLLNHFDLEEMLVLPLAAAQRSQEAEWLRTEHDAIRADLGELGIAVDRSAVRLESIEALAERLAVHARREHAWLYPWADGALDEARGLHLGRRLRAAWKRAGHAVRHPSGSPQGGG